MGSTSHKGNDFATPIGTPLRAVHSGTVVAVGWYGGFGMRVEIALGGGTSVIYGHMSAFSATVGEKVSPGEVIGYSGNTGNSTGPHLHFEVHVGGVAVDPGPWMRARGIF
ncbi:M23 family metallopeptidase [Branchiibius cervicis]|uniref:M23 family metallopeptidase n=1 Tax=Branchiibius cervicis TaxID=908252 RepID=A0ABW2AVR4_9MICO